MSRREFSPTVYAAIVKRATTDDHQIVCEGCGLVLGKKAWHIDHTIPDAMMIDKSRKLTAAEGKLLGVECCHAPKTKIDQGNIAKAKAVEAKDLGIKRSKQSFPRPPKQAKASNKIPVPPPRQLFEKRTQT